MSRNFCKKWSNMVGIYLLAFGIQWHLDQKHFSLLANKIAHIFLLCMTECMSSGDGSGRSQYNVFRKWMIILITTKSRTWRKNIVRSFENITRWVTVIFQFDSWRFYDRMALISTCFLDVNLPPHLPICGRDWHNLYQGSLISCELV